MITVGDAQNSKRKIEDPGNPRVFPHTKAYLKHYYGKIAAGLLVVTLIGQLIPSILDFCYGEPKRNDRRDVRR